MTNIKRANCPKTYQELYRIFAPSIGNDLAEKAIELLAELYGGSNVYCKKASRLNLQARNKRIIEESRAGKSDKDVARKVGLTRMFVRRLVNSESDTPLLSFVETLIGRYREIFDLLSPSIGAPVAEKIVLLIADNFGGTVIYFPAACCLYKSRRYEEIAKAYNGTNLRELSSKYDLAADTIRKVAKAYRTQKQLSLFETPPNSN